MGILLSMKNNYIFSTGEGFIHCLYAGDINLSLYWSPGFCFISFTTIIQRLYRAGKALYTLSVIVHTFISAEQTGSYTSNVWYQIGLDLNTSLLFTVHVGI